MLRLATRTREESRDGRVLYSSLLNTIVSVRNVTNELTVQTANVHIALNPTHSSESSPRVSIRLERSTWSEYLGQNRPFTFVMV